MKGKILQNRKFKFGSLSVLLTVAAVVLAVIVNVVFTALCQKYSWYVDMTPEKLYGISDVSEEMLDPLGDTDTQIRIVFLQDRDRIQESYYLNLIYQCALTYTQTFDFIRIDFIDMEAHPQQVQKYMTTAATQLAKNNVIIENGSDFRVIARDAFYYVDSETGDPVAFNGEYRITSTILQLTQKSTPIAYFTVGHGETTENSALWNLFAEAGYEVRTIDLTKEDFAADAKVVIVNGPVYDFIGAYEEDGSYTQVNEINKLADFMDAQGNVMLFMDPSAMAAQSFNNLFEFLEEWGIAFEQAVIKDSANAVSVDGYSVVAQYETEGLGASITKSMRALETIPKTILRYAAPIRILWDEKSIDQSVRRVSTILKSSETSQAYAYDDETVLGSGSYDMMVFVQDRIYINNEPYESYLTVCGTSAFSSEKFIASNAYGNADVLYALMKVMGKETVPADIDLRLFEDTSLVVTNSQAQAWTLALTAIIPGAVLICGVVVFIRRRHL